jgi:hypothetical protein
MRRVSMPSTVAVRRRQTNFVVQPSISCSALALPTTEQFIKPGTVMHDNEDCHITVTVLCSGSSLLPAQAIRSAVVIRYDTKDAEAIPDMAPQVTNLSVGARLRLHIAEEGDE